VNSRRESHPSNPPTSHSFSLAPRSHYHLSKPGPASGACHWLDHRPITSPIHLLLFFISLSPKPGPASGALSLAGPQANHLLLFSSLSVAYSSFFFPELPPSLTYHPVIPSLPFPIRPLPLFVSTTGSHTPPSSSPSSRSPFSSCPRRAFSSDG